MRTNMTRVYRTNDNGNKTTVYYGGGGGTSFFLLIIAIVLLILAFNNFFYLDQGSRMILKVWLFLSLVADTAQL